MKKNTTTLSHEEISAFCQQIGMIVKAGLPTYYGISILVDEAEDAETKQLLQHIYDPMEKGASLYDAIAPLEIFPHYMVQMIQLGEQTGRLEEVLDSLTVYYEREAEIRSGIKHAVFYPLIMTAMMIAILIVMIQEIVPIFGDVYNELGSSLSGTALVLLNVSTFLNRYLLIFVLGVVGLAFFLFLLSRTSFFKRQIEKSKFYLCVAASRFANCMYLALASGLDTEHGLDLAENLIDNACMKEKIAACRQYIKDGEGFANAILSSGIFSKMHSSVLKIGAKTGSMDDVMLRIGKRYEQETDERLQHFVSILEPSLIIILSFFIGLILISFLLPLLGIMSSIG